MRVRPALVIAAMLVAIASGFVGVEHTGEVTEFYYESAGLVYMLILVPAMFSARNAARRPNERVHAALVLIAAVVAVVLSIFLRGMLGLGEGLGTLLTLKASTTKISTVPTEVGAAASGVAAIFAGMMLFGAGEARRAEADADV